MKSFRNMAVLLALVFYSSLLLVAQTKVMPEYNVNVQQPGATYKFSFVHITDVHIGEGFSDYGTPGFVNDTMPAVDNSQPAKSLREAVKWINANYQEKNIRFVIVSGDLTGSAETSEFMMFKSIMKDLKVPYVPCIGNHDVWSYVRFGQEAPYAYGDSLMNEIFAEEYDKARLFFDNWNDGTRLTRTYNPETGLETYLQNFSFEYEGAVFYITDFNPRYHVRKEEPGIGPEAQLMNWSGGTFQWFKKSLENQTNKKPKNTFVVSHHPPTDNFLIIAAGFAFEYDELNQLTNMLVPFRQQLALWMSGHVHRNADYKIAAPGGIDIVTVREMGSNKDYDSSHFEIVNVYEIPQATAIMQGKNELLTLIPNAGNGVFQVSGMPEGSNVWSAFDATGRKVAGAAIPPFYGNQQNTAVIDISFLPAGWYQITVLTQKGVFSAPYVRQ